MVNITSRILTRAQAPAITEHRPHSVSDKQAEQILSELGYEAAFVTPGSVRAREHGDKRLITFEVGYLIDKNEGA